MEREGANIGEESRQGGGANACANTFDERSVFLERGVERVVGGEDICIGLLELFLERSVYFVIEGLLYLTSFAGPSSIVEVAKLP